jgi:hypothetical protein
LVKIIKTFLLLRTHYFLAANKGSIVAEKTARGCGPINA